MEWDALTDREPNEWYREQRDRLSSRLIGHGAWRTQRTRDGLRPVDIARKQGHTHLLELLEPVEVRPLPSPAEMLAPLPRAATGENRQLLRGDRAPVATAGATDGSTGRGNRLRRVRDDGQIGRAHV